VLASPSRPSNAAAASSPQLSRDDEVRTTTEPRLAACRQLAQQYCARFIVIAPAVPESADGATGLLRAGERTGVPILVPVKSGALDNRYREDGFHMNEGGAPIFTESLSASLRPMLATWACEHH
jgi:lysophospholipase L1-like esterase